MVSLLGPIKIDLKYAKIIFWDFDGVIKDSVDVKTQAFQKMFEPFGTDVIKQVTTHHKQNGGISRFIKIPLYLESYAGQKINDEMIAEYLEIFSNMVLRRVIDSPWIPGVLDIIKKKDSTQIFVMVTGTPENEICIILKKLKINHYFDIICGSPNKKETIIKSTLNSTGISADDCILFGDSYTDFYAAKTNDVPFVYVKSSSNEDERIIPTYMIKNFREIVDD